MADKTIDGPATPHATTTSSPPADTYTEAKLTPGNGALIYWPEKNAFLAVYDDERLALLAEADDYSTRIAALQEANRGATMASSALRDAQKANVKAQIDQAEANLATASSKVQAASDAVKEKIEPLQSLDATDGVRMVEMVAFKSKKFGSQAAPIYIKSTSIKRVLAEKRIYLVGGETKSRPSEKLLKNGKLNIAEIKHRITDDIQDKARFSKEWKIAPEGADEYAGVLFNWARTMNGDIASFLDRKKEDIENSLGLDPTDPNRRVDLTADAQLMRYSAGAGLEANFNPFKGNLHDPRDKNWIDRAKRGIKSGQFGIKGNAHAAFSIAEGKVRTQVYLPHYAGWHVIGTVAGQTFEFGYIRLHGDLVLAGSVGASVAIETDIEISYAGGKQGLRGAPRRDRVNKKGVQARAGAKGSISAFAGARGSIQLLAELQWLNPEGDGDQTAGATAKSGEALGEYKTMAKIEFEGGATAGVGIQGAFKIGLDRGNYVIHVKGGACLGVGADGSFTFTTGYETIYEFLKFVAYQLKRADFHKIYEFIEQDAYEDLCRTYYLIVATGKQLTDFVGKSRAALAAEYQLQKQLVENAIANGGQAITGFLQRFERELKKRHLGWFMYSPPEVQGQILRHLFRISKDGNIKLGEHSSQLMLDALGAFQTQNQLATVEERMTQEMGDKQPATVGRSMIAQCLGVSASNNALASLEVRLNGAQYLVSKPYIWNVSPTFIQAHLGIEDAMYS